MHSDLVTAFARVVAMLQKDPRCKGGWHYGSVSRGETDAYSDYDPVFLVAGRDFADFAADVPKVLAAAADELLLFWGESFNDAQFKNYGSVIRIGDELHQFDFFIVNADCPQDWMCRQHCKGCTTDHIIFDRSGEVAAFLNQGYRTDNDIPDTVRAIDTFWFHVEMLVKYFKRGDLFKLIKNLDILFHAHVDLLLSRYDTLDWGGWESKVKRCVPVAKQVHLTAYFSAAELGALETVVRRVIPLFRQDAEEICMVKGIDYPPGIADAIVSSFERRMASQRSE